MVERYLFTLLILFFALTDFVFARESAIEAVDKNNLRVCADPTNLPFSNENGDGYENDIAKLIGEKLNIYQLYMNSFLKLLVM